MATVADLLPQIFARVEEPDPANPVFWNIDQGVFAAIESLNEMTLLVGRPTQVVSAPFTIQPNTPFQTIPKGIFCLTDIQGYASQIYKVTLQDFDYLQVYGGSDWQQDVGQNVQQWCPIGLTKFIVHPIVPDYETVLLTGIAYPTTQSWPYDPTTIEVPFADQFLQAFEKYASHYLRFLESGDEFSESYKVYQSFLDDAKRMTEIEDRMDPWLFATGVGVPSISNPTSLR